MKTVNSSVIPHGKPLTNDPLSSEAHEASDSNQAELSGYLAGIREKNEDALSEFYDRTLDRVYGVAIRITGVDTEAEEVVSDVYWQVWQQADRYDPKKASIVGWLLTLCRSRAIDQLRKQKGVESVSSDKNPSESSGEISSPEYLLSNLQDNTRIHNALESLSTEQRQLLSLAFFRGMSYSEVAEYIGMPLGTVKSHIRRGLSYLKTEATLQHCWASYSEGEYGKE